MENEDYRDYADGEYGEYIDLDELERKLQEMARVQRAHQLASTLDEFEARHWEISKRDVDELRATIENAAREEDIQRFLAEHPQILTQHLGGGHGRWCIAKKRLGSEYIPDFLIAELSSIGFEWYGVELENPKAILFNQKGDPSGVLTHAIRQITDWRAWLKNNIGYAQRPRDKNGLGLIDIDANLPCYVLIGRRRDLSESSHVRRRQMSQDLNVEIHTYGWLR